MARPRKLTAAQEQQLAALTAEVGPREASRRAPEVVGCEVSPATCLRLLEQQRKAAPDPEAPLRQERAESPGVELAALADDADDADDLEVLLMIRRLASKAALSAGEKRLLLAAIDRIASLTGQIIKLREQQAPSRKVGILILPPEEP